MGFRLAAVVAIVGGCAFCLDVLAGYAPENASREDRFANPPASARMLPIWHDWKNDPAAWRRGLDNLESKGFGGFVGNANFGNGYVDSSTNLAAFVGLVAETKKRGLRVWLYDEPGYPSGTAGGAVTKNHPDRVAKGYLFSCVEADSGETAALALPPGRLVAAAAWPLDGGRLVAAQRCDVECPSGATNLVWTAPATSDGASCRWKIVAWSVGDLYEGTHAALNLSRRIPYINLLSPEPTDAFIATTHEKYSAAFGGDLSAFDSLFTDEPSLMSFWMRPMPWGVLPYAAELVDAWHERTGRDLDRDAPLLAFGTKDENAKHLRYAFWDAVGRLVSANYMHRLDVWARAHGTRGGGHLLMEEWTGVHLPNYGDFFRCLRALGNPGVDMLNSIPDKVSPQTAKLGGSAGALNGAKRVMCEVSDHVQLRDMNPPHQVTEDEIAGTLNRLLWGGVNTFTSYYVWKPFTDEQIARINLRLARANTLLSEGADAADVALLYPADTMKTSYDALANPWCEVTGEAAHAIASMQTAVNSLFAGNRAWMFVDASSLASAHVGTVQTADGKAVALVRGNLAWRVVILPNPETLQLAAMQRLGEFVRAGGTVIAFGALPANSETEFPSSEVKALSHEIFNDKNRFPRERIGEAAAIVSRIVEPPVAIAPESDAAPIRMAHRRGCGKGDVFFVMNDAAVPWRGRLRLCGGGAATRWDPQTGEHAAFSFDGEGWGEIAIPSYGAMLFTTVSPANPRQIAGGNAK